MSEILDLMSHSNAETERLGKKLGELLRPGDVVSLEGGLGVGKTCLARGIAAGLRVTDPVRSPSFTLVNEYAGKVPMYHIDLYRVEGKGELATVGLDEYLDKEGVVVVEWPERAGSLLPRHNLTITIEWEDETDRRILMDPHGTRYEEILEQLRARLQGGRKPCS